MRVFAILVCSAAAFVDAGVLIEGNLQGGEIAKGRWKPDLSVFSPFAKKAEENLPQSSRDEIKKIHHFLEHVHTPGCSWDLMVSVFSFHSYSPVRIAVISFPAAATIKVKIEKEFSSTRNHRIVAGFGF